MRCVSNASNILEDCFGGSRAEFYEYYTITGVVERVLPPIWLVFGIPGNIMCAFTWFNRQVRRHTSEVYLGCLAIVEAMLLLLNIVTYLDRVYEVPTTRLPVWCQAFPVIFYLVQYMHPLLILAYTVDRWYSVWYPFKSEVLCTVRVTIVVMGTMVILCFAVSLVQIFFYEYHPNACDMSAQLVDPSTTAHVFYTRWTWTIETFLFGAVPLIVLTLNVSVLMLVRKLNNSEIRMHEKRLESLAGTTSTVQLAIVSVNSCPIQQSNKKKKRSRGQAATTLTLLTMSFYFTIMSLSVSIATALYLNYDQGNFTIDNVQTIDALWDDPVWCKHFVYITVRTIIDDVALSQHAVGFYIYFITSRPFRRLNLRLLARCVPHVRKILNNEHLREMKILYGIESQNTRLPTSTPRRFSAAPAAVSAKLDDRVNIISEIARSTCVANAFGCYKFDKFLHSQSSRRGTFGENSVKKKKVAETQSVYPEGLGLPSKFPFRRNSF